MEEILEENYISYNLLSDSVFSNIPYTLLSRLKTMKNWEFRVIIAIILIQSIYLSLKFDSIEKQQQELEWYARNIDENVATVDARILDMSYRIKYVEDKL